jgi:hypothetical protein
LSVWWWPGADDLAGGDAALTALLHHVTVDLLKLSYLSLERDSAAVESMAELEPVGELALKGLHRPVLAFNVRELRS